MVKVDEDQPNPNQVIRDDKKINTTLHARNFFKIKIKTGLLYPHSGYRQPRYNQETQELLDSIPQNEG
jgi:hypothetical protein